MTVEAVVQQVALVSDTPGWLQALVASLPRSLRKTDTVSTADLVLVDGEGQWPQRLSASLAQGARKLVLVEPGYADPAAVRSVIDAANAVAADCTIVEALPDSPALEGFRNLLATGFDEMVIFASGPISLDGMALMHLRLLRALNCKTLQFNRPASVTQAFVVDGSAKLGTADMRLRLSGSLAPDPARLSVAAYSGGSTAHLEWSGGAEADPIKVGLADSSGLRLLPAMHEGGHRQGLRTILRRLCHGIGTGTLRDLADDIAMARTIIDAP